MSEIINWPQAITIIGVSFCIAIVLSICAWKNF